MMAKNNDPSPYVWNMAKVNMMFFRFLVNLVNFIILCRNILSRLTYFEKSINSMGTQNILIEFVVIIKFHWVHVLGEISSVCVCVSSFLLLAGVMVPI